MVILFATGLAIICQRGDDMSTSNKPVIWSLFAAGGTITALLTPILVLLFALAVPLGFLSSDIFSYSRIEILLDNTLLRLVLFAVLFLSLWHAAHRMRITLHDFGLRADGVAMILLYGVASLASLLLIFALV